MSTNWNYNYKRVELDDEAVERTVTLTLTPQAQETLKDTLFTWLELEVMQGTKTPLTDERTRFCFNVDEEKGEKLKAAIMLLTVSNN